MLETLESELPRGVIRYSSKVVHIAESNDRVVSVHLADGTVLKTKVELLALIELSFLHCNEAKFDNHVCDH